MNLRTVMIRGTLYVRAEDMVELIREFAGSEETDTRNRLHELANNLLKSTEKVKPTP